MRRSGPRSSDLFGAVSKPCAHGRFVGFGHLNVVTVQIPFALQHEVDLEVVARNLEVWIFLDLVLVIVGVWAPPVPPAYEIQIRVCVPRSEWKSAHDP